MCIIKIFWLKPFWLKLRLALCPLLSLCSAHSTFCLPHFAVYNLYSRQLPGDGPSTTCCSRPSHHAPLSGRFGPRAPRRSSSASGPRPRPVRLRGLSPCAPAGSSGMARRTAALLTVCRGHEVIAVHDRRLAESVLAGGASAPDPPGAGDAVLPAALTAASRGLNALCAAFPLDGPASQNFGAALRVRAVRDRLEGRQVRGHELLRVLGHIASAADAGRHLTAATVLAAQAGFDAALAPGATDGPAPARAAGDPTEPPCPRRPRVGRWGRCGRFGLPRAPQRRRGLVCRPPVPRRTRGDSGSHAGRGPAAHRRTGAGTRGWNQRLAPKAGTRGWHQ